MLTNRTTNQRDWWWTSWGDGGTLKLCCWLDCQEWTSFSLMLGYFTIIFLYLLYDVLRLCQSGGWWTNQVKEGECLINNWGMLLHIRVSMGNTVGCSTVANAPITPIVLPIIDCEFRSLGYVHIGYHPEFPASTFPSASRFFFSFLPGHPFRIDVSIPSAT